MKRSTFVKYSVPVLAIDLLVGTYASKVENSALTNNALSALVLASSVIGILSSSAVHGRIEEELEKWIFLLANILLTITVIGAMLFIGIEKIVLLGSNLLIVVCNLCRYANYKMTKAKLVNDC